MICRSSSALYRLAVACLGIMGLVASRPAIAQPVNSTNAPFSCDASDYLKHVVSLGAVSTNAGPVSSNPVPETEASKLVTVDALDDQHKLGIADKVSFHILEDKIFGDEKDDPKPLYVTDSGELEIPYLGRIPAIGKTCAQLAAEIKAVLEKKYYYHATVLVGVDILNKTRGRVYLSGKVKLPGYQDIPTDETFTVSKAIMRAGGFSEFADKRHVKVTRQTTGSSSGGEILTLDVVEVLEKGLAGKDLELHPDDRVFVPSKLINF